MSEKKRSRVATVFVWAIGINTVIVFILLLSFIHAMWIVALVEAGVRLTAALSFILLLKFLTKRYDQYKKYEKKREAVTTHA